MELLVDCVGLSARKKVLESGRKPRVFGVWSLSGKSGMRGEGGKGSYKELRFDPLVTPIPHPYYSALAKSEFGDGIGYHDSITITPMIAIAAAAVTNETINLEHIRQHRRHLHRL